MLIKTPLISQLYKKLLQDYGDPGEFWPQWCESVKDERLRQIVAIGAVLVQRTSWNNAERALKNLRDHNLISIRSLAEANIEELTALIRVAGFYTTKPRRLVALCKFVSDNYGSFEKMTEENDIKTLREKLLSVYGIGPETADTLLLFALDKPSFIVDAYTKRFVEKYSLFELRSDEITKKVFENNLPQSPEVYRNYHILKILDQRPRDKCYMEIV